MSVTDQTELYPTRTNSRIRVDRRSAIGTSQRRITPEPSTSTPPATASAISGETRSEMTSLPSRNGITARPPPIAIALDTVARPTDPMRSLTYWAANDWVTRRGRERAETSATPATARETSPRAPHDGDGRHENPRVLEPFPYGS